MKAVLILPVFLAVFCAGNVIKVNRESDQALEHLVNNLEINQGNEKYLQDGQEDHSHEDDHDHDHSHEDNHDHDHSHENDHDHDHSHVDDHDHDHSHVDGHDHDHSHEEDHDHDHSHEDDHDHDYSYVDDHDHDHSHEDAHDHDHSHEDAHDHDHSHEDDHDHDHSHVDDHDHDHSHEDDHDHNHSHEDDHDHDHSHEDAHDHDHSHEDDHDHDHDHDHHDHDHHDHGNHDHDHHGHGSDDHDHHSHDNDDHEHSHDHKRALKINLQDDHDYDHDHDHNHSHDHYEDLNHNHEHHEHDHDDHTHDDHDHHDHDNHDHDHHDHDHKDHDHQDHDNHDHDHHDHDHKDHDNNNHDHDGHQHSHDQKRALKIKLQDDHDHDHSHDHDEDNDHDHEHEHTQEHDHNKDHDHDHDEDHDHDHDHDHDEDHDHDHDHDHHEHDHHHDHDHTHDVELRSEDLEWWEETIFYQIYPRSFADSDGDGIGDLNGITSKLEYIKDLGVGAIWMSPMFQSPMYDFGYDISDFYAVHDEYGTMDDFDVLMKKAEELGLKVILDLVPNHTSNESVWFQEALKGSDNKYYNYFVWEDGIVDEYGNMQPPNNWLSHFRGSAWEYREEVGKYYLHQFVVGQPDLNYRNPEVVEEMKNIIRFWLEKGVAGFRVDAVNCLFEVDKELFGGKYPDEPSSGRTDVDAGSHDSLAHIYTKDQNETYYMVYDWRDVLDEFKARDGVTRIMMTEVYADIKDVVRYFGEGERAGAQMPFNFDLISDVNGGSSAADMKRATDKFLTYKPVDKIANWVVGNHDNSRLATKFGVERVDSINMMVLLLPGVGVTYMGEEIGMVDGYVSWEDTVDPSGCNTNDPINYWKSSRDPERTPFQWNAEKNAGFSTADKTWLPVAEGYEILNVEVQKAAEKSHLKFYQTIAELRKDKIFRYGRYESLALNQDVFVFRRWQNNKAYLVVINFGEIAHDVDLTYFENVPKSVQVVVASTESEKNAGDEFSASSFPVAPFEGVVVKAHTSWLSCLPDLSDLIDLTDIGNTDV